MQYRHVLPITGVLAILVAGGLGRKAALGGTAHKRNQRGIHMDISKVELTQLLRSFEMSGDIQALEKALTLVASMRPSSSGPRTEVAGFRAEKLYWLLAVFNAIDSKLKPDFDFEDHPMLNVAPPPESGLPAGVDPANIKDPGTRAQFEKEIAANQIKKSMYELQSSLRKIERANSDAFRSHLSTHYTKAFKKVVDSVIDETIHSKQRKTSLKDVVLAILP
jgi:hypothetical protein